MPAVRASTFLSKNVFFQFFSSKFKNLWIFGFLKIFFKNQKFFPKNDNFVLPTRPPYGHADTASPLHRRYRPAYFYQKRIFSTFFFKNQKFMDFWVFENFFQKSKIFSKKRQTYPVYINHCYIVQSPPTAFPTHIVVGGDEIRAYVYISTCNKHSATCGMFTGPGVAPRLRRVAHTRVIRSQHRGRYTPPAR